MAKSIFLIHGRNFKPPGPKLRKLWMDTIEWGLQRDYPASKLNAFRRANKQFIYYGDLSNAFLKQALGKPANFKTDDSASRRATLNALKGFAGNQFTKRNYNSRPGKSSAGETLADLFGGVAAFFRISDPIIGAIAPDLCHYWHRDAGFGSNIRARLTTPLANALRRGDKIMIIAHSLGAMMAYDTLWKFSHYSEYTSIRSKKLDLFVTTGCPLADETVKRHLKGADASKAGRYPGNIRRWVNVAAEDDYIAHDEKVRNDFRGMLKYTPTESIRDLRIYNLAVRDGKSNPHHSGGYLVHPKMTDLIAGWV